MILPWMLYAGAVALLLGVAAACAETVARARGCPVRGLWMGALLGSVLLPVATALLAAAPFRFAAVPEVMWPSATAERAGEAWRAPFALLDRAASVAADPWPLGGWGAGSLAAVGAIGASYLRLRRRGREWSFRVVNGHGIWASRDAGPAAVGFLSGAHPAPAAACARPAPGDLPTGNTKKAPDSTMC
jgi:hypothetical protein